MHYKQGLVALIGLGLLGCSQPAPVVNVQPPTVNVPAPVVNIPAPVPAVIPSAYSLNIVGGNDQVGSSGAAFPQPLVVQAVDAKGQGVPELSLNVLSDARLCSTPNATLTTDAEGKASLVLTAGTASDVRCQTAITLNGQPSGSRSAVVFSNFVRPAQRTLVVPNNLNLPSATLSIQDGAQSRFDFREFSNWPLLPPSYTFAAYAFRLGPNSEIECVRYLGAFPDTAVAGSLTVSMNLTTVASSPAGCGSTVGTNTTGSAAALSINAVAVVLQSTSLPPAAVPSTVQAAFLIGSGTVAPAGGLSRMELTLRALSLQSLTRFEMVPYSPQGVLVLESPYLAYNAYNSGFSATLSNFPRNPSGYRYAVYRINSDDRRFRIARFSVDGSGEPVKIAYRLPLPSNANPPGQPLDQKSEFRRVFVTLEPVSVSDNDFPSTVPSSLVVMDTETTGAWTMRVR